MARSTSTSNDQDGGLVKAFGLPLPSASWFEEERPQSYGNMAPPVSGEDRCGQLRNGFNVVGYQPGSTSDGVALINELNDVLGFGSPSHEVQACAHKAPTMSESKCNYNGREYAESPVNNSAPKTHQVEAQHSKRRSSSKNITSLSVKKQSFRLSGKSIKKALSTTFLSKFVGGSSSNEKQGKKVSASSLRSVLKRPSIRSSKNGGSITVEHAAPRVEDVSSPIAPQVVKENSSESEVYKTSSVSRIEVQNNASVISELSPNPNLRSEEPTHDNNDSFESERSDHLSVHVEEDDDGQDEKNGEDTEEFHESETWFGANSLKKEREMVEEDRQKADDAFYQKLKRAQNNQKNPHRLTKRPPSEAYGVQSYDYGGTPGRRVGMRRAVSNQTVDKAASVSHSYDDDSTVASCHSVGITRPQPVENDARGNFILPTVVVRKSLFRGEQREQEDVSSPAPKRNTKVTSPTSILGSPNGAFSPLASPRVVTHSPIHRSSSGSYIRSVHSTDNMIRPPSLPCADDELSVGSNASGFTHYSRDSLGSVSSRHSVSSNVGRPRNVARMIHNSVEHSGQVQNAEFGNITPAIPAYVMALEQKVQDLEDKLEALDHESQSSSLRLRDPNLSSLFVLLLEPVQRKFELVQVSSYLLKDTVGDVLRQVYQHATVPLLANQTYRGFCRPKDGIEMVLTESPIGKVPGGWRVVEGEILVGIPQGSTGQDCALMSQPILQNPKVVRLLRRKKPMSAVSRTSSSRRRRSSSSARNQIAGQVIDDIDSEVQRSLARLLLGQSARNLVAVHEE